MTSRMEVVYDKLGIRKETRLPRHAIWSKSTSKVVYHPLRSFGPSCDHHRENIIAPLSEGDAVKPVTYAVSAPRGHDAPGKPLLFVKGVVFGAFLPPRATFMHLVVLQPWVSSADAVSEAYCINSQSVEMLSVGGV